MLCFVSVRELCVFCVCAFVLWVCVVGLCVCCVCACVCVRVCCCVRVLCLTFLNNRRVFKGKSVPAAPNTTIIRLLLPPGRVRPAIEIEVNVEI